MKYFIFIFISINIILIFGTNISQISYIDGDYFFPFPTISKNYSEKVAVDLSYLNWKIEERIKIKDGHFYYKNKQVRFFGTNVAYSSAFPPKTESPYIAKRMAQLGINVVRFHHMDSRDIWKDNANSILSPEKLDLLHYFLFCLKNNGIYANLNLHVSRIYPEISKESEILEIFKYCKSLDRYYPQFIKDQMNYARDLLNSYNNYTGYKLGEDPMILNIELNNENTMFNLEKENYVRVLNTKLKNELENQWKTYIKNKYKNYEEINSIYNNETIDLNNDLVLNNSITCQKDNGNYTITDKKVLFNINDTPKVSWGNQIHFGSINIENYTLYTLEFDAKVEKETNDAISISFQENASPYRTYLRISNIKLTTKLEHYIFSAKTDYNCQFSETSKAKPKIILPTSINNYEINNMKIYKGRKDVIFTENGEKNLDKILYPNSTLIQNLPNMAYDLRFFFYNTEITTQKNLTNYIKNDLGFKNLFILDSQINYGSFLSFVRESEFSDISDIHAYWEHPSFAEGHSWDKKYYSVKNTPMFKSKTFGTFNRLSKGKHKNKPYTISEYNHPFPSEHLHEKFAFFGSWGAFHDFDAIYQFSYDQTDNQYISSFFSMATNPADFALAPYTVLAFRNNYVKKSKNFVKVKLTKGYIYEKMKDKNYNMDQFLEKYFHPGWNAIFEVEILDEMKIVEPIIESNIDMKNRNINFIDEQITWNISEGINQENFYLVKNDKYITLSGYLGNSKMDIEHNLGNILQIKLKLNDTLNETCTIGLISLDNKSLNSSEKILLTIVGKIRNTEQIWNENRTSTSQGWGKAPTLVQYIEMSVIFNFEEKEKPVVYSINDLGELNKQFNIEGQRGKWVLKSDENNPTLNYYIIRNITKENIDENEQGSKAWIWIIVILVILAALGIGVWLFIRNKRKKKLWGLDSKFL